MKVESYVASSLGLGRESQGEASGLYAALRFAELQRDFLESIKTSVEAVAASLGAVEGAEQAVTDLGDIATAITNQNASAANPYADFLARLDRAGLNDTVAYRYAAQLFGQKVSR